MKKREYCSSGPRVIGFGPSAATVPPRVPVVAVTAALVGALTVGAGGLVTNVYVPYTGAPKRLKNVWSVNEYQDSNEVIGCHCSQSRPGGERRAGTERGGGYGKIAGSDSDIALQIAK